jgi:antitoxin (DNA-binding transcriptional repressor) of toxin-antitoxin stability system
MKSVGIREFRDKASQYLASREAVAVKRHGKIVGFYIPVEQSEEIEIEQALQRLNQTVETAIAESGMDEATLARALDLSESEQ